MEKKDPDRELSDFDARLQQARATRKGPVHGAPGLKPETSGIGQALRIGVEMVSALVVGVGLGWFLDNLLGTKPWMMIVFIFLGGAAGILNVYRTAMRMMEEFDEDSKDSGTSGATNGNESGKSAENSPEK